MDFVLANHFRESNAKLRGAHRAGERDHHFSTTIEMRNVGIGSVFQDRGVEMPVMAINELADAAHFHLTNFAMVLLALMQDFYRGSQALIAIFKEIFMVRQRGFALLVFRALSRAKELLPQAQ